MDEATRAKVEAVLLAMTTAVDRNKVEPRFSYVRGVSYEWESTWKSGYLAAVIDARKVIAEQFGVTREPKSQMARRESK